jgi:hypothetical protein
MPHDFSWLSFSYVVELHGGESYGSWHTGQYTFLALRMLWQTSRLRYMYAHYPLLCWGLGGESLTQLYERTRNLHI